jgi:hypothetical protein
MNEAESIGITEALRQWRQAHPEATWDEIESEVQRQLAGFQADLMAMLVGQSGAPDEPPTCARCGSPMRRCGRRSRELLTRMGRAVALERPYYVCSTCGAGLFPPR